MQHTLLDEVQHAACDTKQQLAMYIVLHSAAPANVLLSGVPCLNYVCVCQAFCTAHLTVPDKLVHRTSCLKH